MIMIDLIPFIIICVMFLAPKGLKVVKTSQTSITVNWNPIYDGLLSGYRIKYAKSDSDDYADMRVNFDQTEAEITKLEASTGYKIQVAGIYWEGDKLGPYTDEIEGSTASSKFTNRINVMSILVLWNSLILYPHEIPGFT